MGLPWHQDKAFTIVTKAWTACPLAARCGTDTIPPEPWRRLAMTSLPQPPAWSNRLADQLQLLSEVAESFTYRLLEFEERLACQEQRLLAWQAAGEPELVEELELRLLATDDRLARIEAMLAAAEGPTAARHLQSVRRASTHPQAPGSPLSTRQAAGHAPAEVEIAVEDPFVEEGEQPFMDELIA